MARRSFEELCPRVVERHDEVRGEVGDGLDMGVDRGGGGDGGKQHNEYDDQDKAGVSR